LPCRALHRLVAPAWRSRSISYLVHPAMKAGDSVLLPLPGTVPHPAIVLHIQGEWAHVIYGTGTRREWPCVIVVERSRGAIALGFYKSTYFYATNLRQVMLSELTLRNRWCPPDILLQLRALIQQAVQDGTLSTPLPGAGANGQGPAGGEGGN
jgi:hypothetical protein